MRGAVRGWALGRAPGPAAQLVAFSTSYRTLGEMLLLGSSWDKMTKVELKGQPGGGHRVLLSTTG